MFRKRLLFLQYILTSIHGGLIGRPQFESEWLRITAQTVASEIHVDHGLGAVPGLVEVLVKAIDGPNEGFIFKAIGHGERDDDSLNMYGGVIYIYNDISVLVMAPYGMNGNKKGAAIYTGEAPYWHGINSQTSFSADIKVRCWAATSLPEPCLNLTNIYMQAGSSDVDDTYKEIDHNHTDYPSLVKVRVKLANGQQTGWYSDAQGVSAFNYDSMGAWWVTGGLKYGYNNATIRIWTSSYPAPNGILFARNDGWGNLKAYYGVSSAGYVEVFAWCDLVLSYEQKVSFGPDVTGEDLQFSFPLIYTAVEEYYASIVVQAVDGPNQGYFFEGVGSAMPNTGNIGQPCAYGGLLYAHNDTTVRIWRPDHATGAAICISDSMGFGTNSQASQNGQLIFRVYQPALLLNKIWAGVWMRSNYITIVWDLEQNGQLIFRVYQPASLQAAEEYEPMSLVCSHFAMIGNETAYNSTPIDTQHNVTTLLSCDYSCRQHNTCVTYSFSNDTCHMYNTTDETLLFTHYDSQVWGLKARVVNVQDYP